MTNKTDKIISISQLNDDFCDCPETGIDETSTNACNKGRFYCSNKFALEKYIHSSQVNDGFCDCCDCSDEFIEILPGKPRARKNTCLEEFKAHINMFSREIKDVFFPTKIKKGNRIKSKICERKTGKG